MRVLIVGSGGREHALAWAASRSSRLSKLFIAPGNPGTALHGTNVPVGADNVPALIRFAKDHEVDLVIVGPEQPLVAGLVDACETAGIRAFGPTAAAARLEGSKSFSKAFMQRHGIPTAAFQTFSSQEHDAALRYLHENGAPIVVKASGLAAGKGAIVCEDVAQAEDALREIMVLRSLGEAGNQVVLEEFMQGEEASIFAVSGGEHYVLLPSAQDHKRVGDNDTGPNTGGMGAYAPAPIVSEPLLARVRSEIIEPTLAGMKAEGTPYRGILYCGLMITADGPKVVEFNCRFGDPEAQAVLPLIDSDILDLLEAAVEGNLDRFELRVRSGAAACIVLASGGYPGSYRKGLPISGLVEAAHRHDTLVFHAGTAERNGGIVTSGGRVLGVTGLGADLRKALDRAYAAVAEIRFEYLHYRRDIGRRGLERMAGP